MHRANGGCIGALMGLTTTLLLAGVLYLLAQLQLTTFVPLDMAEAVVRIAPGALATRGIELFGALAKMMIEIASGVIFLGMGALGGALVARQRLAGPLSGGLLAGLLGLVVTVVAQMVANQLADGRVLAVTTLSFLAWGTLLGWSVRQACAIAPAIAAEHAPFRNRRAFLWRSSGIFLALAAGSSAIGELLRQAADESIAQASAGGSLFPGAALPSADLTRVRATTAVATPTTGLIKQSGSAVASSSMPTPTATTGADSIDDRAFTLGTGARPELTATPDLYVVQATFSPPRADASQWQLTIKGLVDHPLTLSNADLRGLPPIDQTSTLTCVSNQVGGPLIGTPTWTGVPLRAACAGWPAARRGRHCAARNGRLRRLDPAGAGLEPAHVDRLWDERRGPHAQPWLPGTGDRPGHLWHEKREVAARD